MLSAAAPAGSSDWSLVGGAAHLGFGAVEGIAGTGSEQAKEYRGEARSRAFARGRLTLDYKAGPGCQVRIEDAQTGTALRSLQSGGGRSAITLDFSRSPSLLLRIRAIDQSERGFAAVYAVSVK